VRELVLTDLVKDVLGPRNGIYEIMNVSPRSEYITGILAPKSTFSERDPESENAFFIEVGAEEVEEGELDENIEVFSPELNPQEIPHSMGLSFCVSSVDGIPEIEVCATWARYFQNGKSRWKRDPRAFVCRIAVDGIETLLVDGKGNIAKNSGDAEIMIRLESKKLNCNVFHTSLYMVNTISPEGNKNTEEDCIFQPQLRVVCAGNTSVQSMFPQFRSTVMEDEEMDFLYRNKPVLARGHLCSAIWKEIDPVAFLDEENAEELPFGWPDGEIVRKRYGENTYIKFRRPDVRTEFVPLYSIQNPDFSWHGNDKIPEFDPKILSELWDAQEIREKLIPLCEEYGKWIEEQEKQIISMKDKDREIARRLLDRCRTVMTRIKKGIELLEKDREIRLCFCFANRAIYLQSEWAGSRIKWRPFQLAFILMVLESIVNPDSTDREVCDLLWIPTGGGKTETYLAIIAFTLALRRRRAMHRKEGDRTGGGVAVITRYTLRLLTIQQFRRALRLITACEYLRVDGMNGSKEIGWRPEKCDIRGHFIWGTARFSAGLWVGGNVTPNRLTPTWNSERQENIPGALGILRGEKGEGEPAQVLECPACGSFLALPDEKGINRPFTLHLVVSSDTGVISIPSSGLSNKDLTVRFKNIFPLHGIDNRYYLLSFEIQPKTPVTSTIIDKWWDNISPPSVELISARASRPGYFIRKYRTNRGRRGVNEYDFDIFCTNPECPLHVPWTEAQPAGCICDSSPHPYSPTVIRVGKQEIDSPDGNKFVYVPEVFRHISPYISDRIPIPAMVTDSQIYARCPSLVVATVDKFARLPFEPRAASIFGNVEYHHCIYGFYRGSLLPLDALQSSDGHPSPAGQQREKYYREIRRFDPPELIIQDELHLIEGPLGSLAGLYETAVEHLCGFEERKPKYIASTATVTRAAEQIQSIFTRKLIQFPPPGINISDRFFMKELPANPLDDGKPGRLYAGICAPGRGPLTPIIRIWARLLQTVYELVDKKGKNVDPYWTVTGYFNAIKELAGARATYWQDIPERLRQIADNNNLREIMDTSEHVVELSGRTASTELPAILDLINSEFSGDPRNPGSPDALFTTSMFGTGIDIKRLGLMVVHGQPKTTSAYIQSTGRVGRGSGALVVVFYRATRPRDMSHYEMFCGYHQSLDRFVEPVTVSPFSPGALNRAGGAVATAVLRNIYFPGGIWHREDSAKEMASRRNEPEVTGLPEIMEKRAQNQPQDRRPHPGYCEVFIASELDRWENIARSKGEALEYVEYFKANKPVVLGDPAHEHAGLKVVFRDVPQSMRDIEETITFRI
jgi:hypothetical protein